MKVSITGHTSGIGLKLYEHFKSLGNECSGFSRSNGFDIRIPKIRDLIIKESSESDIFINNAYSNFDRSQFLILEKIYNTWKGQDKIIFNVSSRITDYKIEQNNILKMYYDTKLEQNNFCLGKIKLPFVCNLLFGLVDTPRVQSLQGEKISIDHIVKIVDFIIENKKYFHVSSLTAGF
jgi:hypothetical protein